MSETTTRTFDTQAAIKAQRELCKEKQLPHFAPGSGRCYSCGTNIYEPQEYESGGRKWVTGVSVEEAGGLITGCPHCNYSFCD